MIGLALKQLPRPIGQLLLYRQVYLRSVTVDRRKNAAQARQATAPKCWPSLASPQTPQTAEAVSSILKHFQSSAVVI